MIPSVNFAYDKQFTHNLGALSMSLGIRPILISSLYEARELWQV